MPGTRSAEPRSPGKGGNIFFSVFLVFSYVFLYRFRMVSVCFYNCFCCFWVVGSLLEAGNKLKKNLFVCFFGFVFGEKCFLVVFFLFYFCFFLFFFCFFERTGSHVFFQKLPGQLPVLGSLAVASLPGRPGRCLVDVQFFFFLFSSFLVFIGF